MAQDRKLRQSGLDKIFDGVFISDKIGFEKPSKEFFDAVQSEIGEFNQDEVMISVVEIMPELFAVGIILTVVKIVIISGLTMR